MIVRQAHVVLPGSVQDARAPSGGNSYDLRVCRGLADAGWSVRQVTVPGAWPRPAAVDLRRLAGALAAVPDGSVVLLDGLVACAAPGVVVPHARRLRPVVLVHLPLGDETGASPADAADLDARERRTLRAVAAVVATSTAVGRRLVEHHGLDPARTYVAPPGVDLATAVQGSAPGGRLVCAASVTPRKGHDVLVDALARLAELPWSCVCAGPLDRDPAFADLVRRRVREHRLEDRIRFPGPLAPADLAAVYAASDLLVLASRAEPYGMVVTEALARAIPVVATAVDGVPAALGHASHGAVPGLLVPAGDPAALAAALRRWLTEPELRAELRATAAGRRGELPGWETTVRALAGALAAVAAAA